MTEKKQSTSSACIPRMEQAVSDVMAEAVLRADTGLGFQLARLGAIETLTLQAMDRG